ncbi:multidrug efflux RND transporter periplasmic adaptor MexH [soil metagenome]
MNVISRRTRGVIAPVLLVVTACGTEKGSAESTPRSVGETRTVVFSAAQVQHGGVRWDPVSGGTGSVQLEVPGQLVPNQDRTARLDAPARGRVLKVHVQPGQRVTAGQALVTLQSQEASAARADYEKAVAERNSRRAAATYARTARERAERLLAAKAIARQELERAQADDELALSAATQAEAEVQRARAAMSQLGVGSANGIMTIITPLTGVVLSREAVPGSVAEAGAPLATVADPSTLWLEVSVTDRAASALATGSRVRFSVLALPSDTFEARVSSVGGALDPATRTVPVRAAVANTAGRLRPAMFATVWIEGTGGMATVSVPETAVQMLDERPVVFVVTPDGKGGARFERRDVEVGGTVAGRTQLLRGVAASDVVVTAGAFAVKSEFSRAKMAQE